MDKITAIGLMAGTLTTVAFVPQLAKAWKSRSTSDLSWGTVTIFSMGVVLWLVYGLWIDSLPVILANTVTLILQLGIVSLKVKHG